jgi:predicted nucleotidyltransferase
MASGRQVARLVGLTPPAVHAALKELYAQDILRRNIIGKQHIYRLNINNRTVKNILIPVFKTENAVKKDIIAFLRKKIKEKKLENKLISLLLYGSLQKGNSSKKSDVDIAVILKEKTNKQSLEKVFIEDIASQFYEYFGAHLDSYIKTKDEFMSRLKKNQAPVSALMQSYFVIYGKDPLSFK